MKKKKLLEKVNLKDGFTIIEVVLVLAIAGLIFLMVFIALPALQRSQRDTQRRDDIARANTALTQYMANNRNRVPTFFGTAAAGTANLSSSWGVCEITATGAPAPVDPISFCGKYLLAGGDSFGDPDGEAYVFAQNVDGTYPDTVVLALTAKQPSANPWGGFPTEFNHIIYVTYNGRCDGESVLQSTGENKVALQYKLEGGGVVCVQN
jgi:prepilin-type N-terminal cleavage/methylation domain-containing protein